MNFPRYKFPWCVIWRCGCKMRFRYGIQTRALQLARCCSFLILYFQLCVGTFAKPPVAVGVNVTNPQWRTEEDRARILDELRASGITLIRVPMTPAWSGEMGPTIAFIKKAYAQGIRTQLTIWPVYSAGTFKRQRQPGTVATWDQEPLSNADPAKTAAAFRTNIGSLDEAGVVLAAIEMGNEINWTPFNGDFELPGRNAVYDLEALKTDPVARRVAAGYDAYLRMLATVKEVRDASRLNARTPLISAGLADPGAPRAPGGVGPDAVSLVSTLDYLRARGLDDLVDAYGVHTYVSPDLPAKARRAFIEHQVFARCSRMHPCWLTEWGLEAKTDVCPAPDAGGGRKAAALREDFDRFVQAGSLVALIYYEWHGDDKKYDIYRCGALTPTGRAGLAPTTVRPSE